MRTMSSTPYTSFLGLLVASTLLVACGDGATGGRLSQSGPPVETPPDPGDPSDPGDPACEGGASYASTFEAIQDVVFDRHGCTNELCHGGAAAGGLDLSPARAYENIFDVPSSGSSFKRITPGDRARSYLWLKLAAKTNPGSVEIAGAPMPNNLPAISADELELLRLWIYAGAPREGTVLGSAELIDGCLPDLTPITIEPLPPPDPGTGVQFRMPPWTIGAASEFEGCMATYFDFTEQVPPEFRDPSGTRFLFRAFEVRQDPQSHHLLLYYPRQNLEPEGVDLDHEAFGVWTCFGGPRSGQECEPTDLEFCGEAGVCTSRLEPSFACSGYGPPDGLPDEIVGGAPSAQMFWDFPDGAFSQLTMKGVMYWNAHAFNLSSQDHEMQGRVNYYFAQDPEHQIVRISDFGAIFAGNNPPFTVETFCHDHVFPVGARVFNLFGHNHRHGDRFWVTGPDGTLIYENFDFSDPVQGRYDPPLAFDSPDAAERTVEYCITYNNGLREDGSYDVDLVTRASRVPESARMFGGACEPIACVNDGMIGEPCAGADDDAACDTSPGAGDGFCDACRITGGESTENEMFVLYGALFIDPTVPGAEIDVIPFTDE